SSITNPMIDELEALAFANGALATKVSGAGGGGFMMFVCDPAERVRLVRAVRRRRHRLRHPLHSARSVLMENRLNTFVQAEFDKTLANFNAMAADARLREQIAQAVRLCVDALRAGRKLLFAGNGGSAADAQH